MWRLPRARRALLLCLLLQPICSLGEETTRAYRGLWGGLFRQQAGSGEGRPSASDRFRQALADLQSVLHPSNDAAGTTGSGGPAGSTLRHLPSLEEVAAHVGNLTASLLESTHSGSGGTSALLQRLAREFNHSSSAGAGSGSLDAAQLAATVASMQAWALAGLVARSGSGSLSGGGATSSLSSSLDPSSFKQVADPAWASFKPLLQARLQNFGAAEGYNAALLGAAPCGRAGAPTAAAAGCAAASGDALRWGSEASFLLDCSRGGSDVEASHSGASSGGAAAGGSSLSAALHAAASKAASAVEAALERTTSCRLAVASEGGGAVGSGGGALLHHSFERPLLGGVKLDALRVRVCNIAPSTLQYPAALVRGPTISVSSLKLNGRPLLRAPLHMSQAAAATDGCLALLYRLPSRATKNGFALSGFVHLGEGSGGEEAAAAAAAAGRGADSGTSGGGGQFGVGEMASLELTLGEYSALDAAASRLLGGIAGGQGAGVQP